MIGENIFEESLEIKFLIINIFLIIKMIIKNIYIWNNPGWLQPNHIPLLKVFWKSVWKQQF